MDVTAAPVLTGAGASASLAAEQFRTARPAPSEASAPAGVSAAEAATASMSAHAIVDAAVALLDGGHAVGRSKAAELLPSEVPVKAPEFGKTDAEEPGVLKFTVQDADVLARFAIHQETKHVIVTMYQRETGEVIREFPPRQVLDVMAALAGKGLAIDVKR